MFGAFGDFGAFLFIRKMKNNQKSGFALYPVEAGGGKLRPPPRYHHGAGLNFTFPHNLFADPRPILGLLATDFCDNYSQNFGHKRGLQPEERGSDWGQHVQKIYFATTEAGLGIVPENGLLQNTPMWGVKIKPVQK